LRGIALVGPGAGDVASAAEVGQLTLCLDPRQDLREFAPQTGVASPSRTSAPCCSRNGRYGIFGRDRADYSALMPANFTTFAHFSVSSAMNFPKSAGEPANTAAPRSVRRFFMLGSARAALISLLSFSTMPVGVALGRRSHTSLSPQSPGEIRPRSGRPAKAPDALRWSLPARAACRP